MASSEGTAPAGAEGKGPYGIRTRAAAVRGRCPRPLDEWAPRGRSVAWLRLDLAEQRARVERVEAEAGRDLLAGRLRALAEELLQELARLAAAPPVLADGVDQVPAQ